MGWRVLLALVLILGAVRPSDVPISAAASPAPAAGLTPLPGSCGSGLPPGTAGAPCCVFGYVILDGQAVSDARVSITITKSGQPTALASVETSTGIGPDSDQPYFRAALLSAGQRAEPGDTVEITASFSSHAHTVSYVVQNGAQQLDVVLPHFGAGDYAFERRAENQPDPGTFVMYNADLAIDGADVVYVTDAKNLRVQAFTRDGRFLRQWGRIGEGPGQFRSVEGIAVDRGGDVYVADQGRNAVHRFTATGEWVSTLRADEIGPVTDIAFDSAGNMYVSSTSDGSGDPLVVRFSPSGAFDSAWTNAANAGSPFTAPQGLAVGPNDELYVADRDSNSVHRISPAGASLGALGVGLLNKPHRVHVAANGDVYVADAFNNRIAIFPAAGPVRFINPSGDNALLGPGGLAFDSLGRLIVADSEHDRIVVFAASGAPLASAGWGQRGDADGFIFQPRGVATDTSGNTYVVDADRQRISKFGLDNKQVLRFPTVGQTYPQGLALDGAGNIFVVDQDTGTLRKYSPQGAPDAVWNAAVASVAGLNEPLGVAADAAGNVYVADTGNHRVRSFSAQGALRWTLGGPAAGTGATQFDSPEDVAVGSDGTIYVADTGNLRVRAFDASRTLRNTWTAADGRAFVGPSALALEGAGALLVGDAGSGTSRLFRINLTDGSSTRYGVPGANEGELGAMYGLAIDPAGRVYVAGYTLQRLRPTSYSLPVATIVSAGPLRVAPGQPVALRGLGAPSVAGNPSVAYEWTLDGAAQPFAISADAALDTSGLAPGNHIVSLRVRSGGIASEPRSVTVAVASGAATASPRTWTFMLYLAGDSPNITPYLNADSQLGALFRLQNAAPNARVTVVALYDGDRVDGGDTFRYLLRPGQPAAVEARPEANMGDGQTLVEFVRWGQQQAPADAYYLAIADHGNALDGIAWDYTSAPDASERLTNAELRQALAEITDNGARPLDVLHLDACLMGLLETAYQLRGTARYLVTSQNLAWSAFAYEQYRAAVGEQTSAADLARAVVSGYAQKVQDERLPYTIAAFDMNALDEVVRRTDRFADALEGVALGGPAGRDALLAVRAQTQKLDSSGTGPITINDEYVDLDHLAELVAGQIADPAARQAATDLRTALRELVLVERHASGVLDDTLIDLANARGASIYYPPRPDARTYQQYGRELQFAADTHWNEFLQAQLAALGAGDALPPPNPVAPLPFPTGTPGPTRYQSFLPIVVR